MEPCVESYGIAGLQRHTTSDGSSGRASPRDCHKTVALKLVLSHLEDDAGFMEMSRHGASLWGANVAQVGDPARR